MVQKPQRRLLFLLFPFIGVVLLFLFLLQFIFPQGNTISIFFSDVHQIKVGDTLKCRGITIGEVVSIIPNSTLTGIILKVQLIPETNAVAREGSRFWIVRPELSMYGVKGLDTVVGAEYIGVIPGNGGPQNTFVGLEIAPSFEKATETPVDIILVGSKRGGINPGMPVTYRNVQIGVISKVDLLRDASGLRVVCSIDAKYKPLLARNASFYNSSGMGFDVGLKGINVAIDSLRSIALGGIALAIPDEPEVSVENGHVFSFGDFPPKGSEDWDPMIDLGGEARFSVSSFSSGIDAIASSTNYFGSRIDEIIGLGIPLKGGVLFPQVLKERTGAQFKTSQTKIPFGDLSSGQTFDDLAYYKISSNTYFSEWSPEKMGFLPSSEDVYAFRNKEFQPKLISWDLLVVSPLSSQKKLILKKMFPNHWNGAAVINKTGYLVGILVGQEKKWEIVPIPAELRNK